MDVHTFSHPSGEPLHTRFHLKDLTGAAVKKFLAQFFPSIQRQALPFKPLATINVPIEASRVVLPFLRARSVLQTTVTDGSGHRTNQFSS